MSLPFLDLLESKVFPLQVLCCCASSPDTKSLWPVLIAINSPPPHHLPVISYQFPDLSSEWPMWVTVGGHSKQCTEPNNNYLYDLEQCRSNQTIQVAEPELNVSLLGCLPSGWAAAQRVTSQASLGLLGERKIIPRHVQ